MMRRKALAFLLLAPFAIAVLSFVTSNYVIREVEQDIQRIDWDYKENEAFSLEDGRISLKAEGIYDDRYPLSEGNNLVWEVENLPPFEDVAYIEVEEAATFLVPNRPGRVLVNCHNEKGNVERRFTATFYDDGGAVIVDIDRPWSQQNIDSTKYVGLYDLSYDTLSLDNYAKVPSSLGFSLSLFGANQIEVDDLLMNYSENISVSRPEGRISFLQAGPAYIEFENPWSESTLATYRLSFEIIDGVNIYSYDDLLMATNFSSDGETIVQRVNLDSLQNTVQGYFNKETARYVPSLDERGNLIYKDTSGATALMGHYDIENDSFSYQEEIYSFPMKNQTRFLEEWNEEANKYQDDNIYPVDLNIYAGFHIQKSWYGNGFVANLHDLAYPRQYVELDPDGVENSGDETLAVMPTKNDIFDGPQLVISLGSPKTKVDPVDPGSPWPMFALYGQDNIGFYVEGNDITLNDVHFKNCDFGNNLTNLEYTGTVVEVTGENIQIQNSVIESGRNVIRAYDAKNFTLENSLIQRAMEYLIRVGSYDLSEPNDDKKVKWSAGGNEYEDTVKSYMEQDLTAIAGMGYKADTLLSGGIMTGNMTDTFLLQAGKDNPIDPYSKEDYINGAHVVAEALTNDEPFKNPDGSYEYGTEARIIDTYFYQSGIASITTDVSPQGSYLYSNITSIFAMLLSVYLSGIDTTGYATTMRPSSISIEGNTRFYDWKTIDNLQFSSVLFQDIYGLIRDHGGVGTNRTITDDDYLPLRKMIKDEHSDVLYKNGDNSYISLPIFENGGGANLSSITYDENMERYFQDQLELDPYPYSLTFSQERMEYDAFMKDADAKFVTMQIAMRRAASHILGFHPYQLTLLNNNTHPWFNETPSLHDLRNQAKTL